MKVTNHTNVAWGITGAGDKLSHIFDTMKKIREEYEKKVNIKVYLSKAGYQVVRHYNIEDDLKKNFFTLHVEKDANSPFLAGALQLREFNFLLVAPASSNTVAKILLGIADTLLSNAAIMALKAFVPVYVLPSDCNEGIIMTELPDGKVLKLRVRKEDAENARKLTNIEGVHVLRCPEEISNIFKAHFG